ncbi:hypothetical protein V6N11_044567 [Hibiscus sabdariffa]|uniref:Uncharacterized protein n=2 Tax=Hibiscus sabdariffa TaxID=183260 RepID=A0ABR2CCX2_9ROSI
MEMRTEGIEGLKIMWVAGSMVLLLFSDQESRQIMLDAECLSAWFDHVEIWSQAVEYGSQRAWISINGDAYASLGVAPNSAPDEVSLGESVSSPRFPRSTDSVVRVRVTSPCWRTNHLWGLDRSAEHRGVVSAGHVGQVGVIGHFGNDQGAPIDNRDLAFESRGAIRVLLSVQLTLPGLEAFSKVPILWDDAWGFSVN